MAIESRDDFIDYCKRKLGAPVLRINIDDDQTDDRINEALIYFQEYHNEATENIFLPYALTAEDIANQFITTPSNIKSVVRLFINGVGIGNWMTNMGQGMIALAYDIGFPSTTDPYSGQTGLASTVINLQNIQNIEAVFGVHPQFQFNFHAHRLIIGSYPWDIAEVGDTIMFEVYRVIDPEVTPGVWTNLWLQEYATCLMGMQWGVNLSKFEGVQLPGGIVLDGNGLYEKYFSRKEKLEEEVSLRFEEPVDFAVG